MSAWAAETLVAGSMLMLLVLAVRRPIAHAFGAGWAYAVWLLVAIRFVLPPISWPGADMSAVTIMLPAATEGGAPAPPVTSGFAWEPLLVTLWLGGAASFAVYHVVGYWRLLRVLGIGSSVQASLGQDVGVIESPHVDGPIAVGLLDKWIVVPADFTSRYGEQERAFALAHEHVHHRREDIAWNVVALAILAFNWFNPIAWAAFRAFRSDQEMSCDAAVMAGADAAARHDYARALVKSASAPGLIAACPLNHASLLKRRLKMMKHHRRSRARTIGGAASLAALLLTGLGATASAAQEQPAAEAKKSIRKIIINRSDAAAAGIKDGSNIMIDGQSIAELTGGKCANKRSESDVTTGEGGKQQRTRIIICGNGPNDGKTREQVLASLEKVKLEMTDDKIAGTEHSARIAAALEKEIARLKAAE